MRTKHLLAGVFLSLLVVGPLMAFSVEIDIKPGDDNPAINLDSNGVVPVAILGTDVFDVTEVDISTVTLAGVTVALKGKSDDRYRAYQEDVNGDGYLDLVVQVLTVDLSENRNQINEGWVTLTGQTESGDAFTGVDYVIIVPPQ